MDIKIVYDKQSNNVYIESQQLTDNFVNSYITNVNEENNKLAITLTLTIN